MGLPANFLPGSYMLGCIMLRNWQHLSSTLLQSLQGFAPLGFPICKRGIWPAGRRVAVTKASKVWEGKIGEWTTDLYLTHGGIGTSTYPLPEARHWPCLQSAEKQCPFQNFVHITLVFITITFHILNGCTQLNKRQILLSSCSSDISEPEKGCWVVDKMQIEFHSKEDIKRQLQNSANLFHTNVLTWPLACAK